LFVHENRDSEIAREDTRVTYVLAFADFYCDARGLKPLDPRIVRGTKVTTVRYVRESGTTYVFDFIIIFVPQRGSLGATRLALRVGLRPIKSPPAVCRTVLSTVRGSNKTRRLAGAEQRRLNF